MNDDSSASPPPSLIKMRMRSVLRNGVPFASGVLAVIVALLLYSAIVPSPHQLTQKEVATSVAQALASVTPAPAYSARVFQVIQPSLVLIQVQGPDHDGKPGKGLGSGVIIDDGGDILTSLHVIAGATNIKLTF